MARIAGVNIPQNKLVQVGLTYIYGIGDKFSKQICDSLEISKSKRVNELTDDQILKIRENIDKIRKDIINEYDDILPSKFELYFRNAISKYEGVKNN